MDGRKDNSNQKYNNDKCRCKFKKHHIIIFSDCSAIVYIWTIAVITCDEIIDEDAETKSHNTQTKATLKNIICEKKLPIFYLRFY